MSTEYYVAQSGLKTNKQNLVTQNCVLKLCKRVGQLLATKRDKKYRDLNII